MRLRTPAAFHASCAPRARFTDARTSFSPAHESSRRSSPVAGFTDDIFRPAIARSAAIIHVNQVKTARGCRCPCRGPASRLEDPRQIRGLQSSLSHKNKRPYKVAHHVMQETRALYRVNQLIALPLPRRRKNSTHIRDRHTFASPLRINRRKGSEVVLSLDFPGRFCHGRLA